jgi:hypothetical protein
MAEETVNASVSSPWGVVATCITVAITGFIYIVGLLYATPTVMGQTYAEWLAAPAGCECASGRRALTAVSDLFFTRQLLSLPSFASPPPHTTCLSQPAAAVAPAATRARASATTSTTP